MSVWQKLDSTFVGSNTALKSIKLLIKSEEILSLASIGVVLMYMNSLREELRLIM